jgi:hypothetical protein
MDNKKAGVKKNVFFDICRYSKLDIQIARRSGTAVGLGTFFQRFCSIFLYLYLKYSPVTLNLNPNNISMGRYTK